MENIQINGQRIWGPPKDWTGQPPSHGTEVFIKNIPEDVFEDELYHLFSQAGKVYEVRLPVHWTGINKGYAFVRFTKISEADFAIERLNFYTIRQGRKIKVERSLDNTRLFLSSVPIQKTGEEIKSDLLTVVENVKTVYVYPALKNPSIFRGYAFVEFICHRDAAIAKRILTPDILFMLFEKKCVAAWANPLPFLSKETLKNINILFMRNLPNNIKTVSIKMAVDSLISPDSVNKIKRVNDYAFLTFKNHELADKALTKMKGNPFFLGMNALQVEWAIPRDLVQTFFSKNISSGSDYDSEPTLSSKGENKQSFLKMLGNYKNDHSKFLNKDYINKNYMDHDNNSLGSLVNTARIKIQQRQHAEFDSLLPFNGIDADRCKAKMTGNDSNYLNKSNGKLPIETMAFTPTYRLDQSFRSNAPARNEDEIFITEFQTSGNENRCRDMHLKTWLQSLSYSNQFASCATSPPPTSPSTGSSTNLSYKWDESCSQLSTGSGISMGYDAKDLKPRGGGVERYSQFAIF